MSRILRSFATFLMGCLTFIAIPLIGWGLLDISGFTGHPARLIYIVLVLFLNAFAAIRIPEIGKIRPPEKSAVSRQHTVVVLLQVLSIAIVLIGPWSDRRSIAAMPDSEVLRTVGLILYIAGFLLMHFAEAQLGRYFSTEVSIRDGQELVTDGLYTRVRHPRYVGIMTFSLGLTLLFRSWLCLFIAATIVLVLFWRIADEERLMSQEFGADWEAYVNRSWRLVPYVY